MPNGTRLGLLAYSSNTGLGVQTWEFARHMKPDRVLLVDLSPLNKTAQHPERYAWFDCIKTTGFPTRYDVTRFVEGLDVVFVCETPLNYDLFTQTTARTVLQPNHEFNDYYQRPDLPSPDLFALPSLWHMDDLPYRNKMHLPVPVAAERFPEPRTGRFTRFLHIAGRPAVHDRNGTLDTIEAFKRADVDATLTVKVQGGGDEYRAAAMGDERISIDSADVPDYWKVYEGFDVLLMPRKYGGLCLPMQEALASGMPVVMTDISPNDSELPSIWRVPAHKTGEFMARTMIDIFTVEGDALTAKIEELAGLNAACAKLQRIEALTLAAARSWDVLESTYREYLC